MPDINGKAFSTNPLFRSPGTVVDAGGRRFRNVVDLAVEGGATANPLVAAIVREGCSVYEARMSSGANLSAINFTIGTDAAPAKYGAAQAGPNATTKTFVIPIAALDDDALTAPETIKFFPSGALPGAGVIVTEIFASKR
jgi:hypothetical protein